MPHQSERQRRAAGAELGRRRGAKKRKRKGRPFAGATIQQLRDFARGRGRTVKVGDPATAAPASLAVGARNRLEKIATGRLFR